MTMSTTRMLVMGAVILGPGCAMFGGPKTFVDLRRVVDEEIASDRYRPLFLAGVEQAEWSLDRGDPETAGNILNGLSYLAYEVRDEISPEGAVGTILGVYDLKQREIVSGVVPGWIYPRPNVNTDCSLTTGNCDVPDTSRICYELYSMPDTLDLGCIAIDNR